MRVRLLAVGQRMPGWVNEGFREYARRLGRDLSLELVEIPPGNRRGDASGQRAVAEEGERMLAQLRPRERVVALDERGRHWRTGQLADKLRDWQMEGDDLALLVGGADGLAQACLERASLHWSLSALTFPHPLVRIILAEQLYRAWTINQGHPYHRS